MKMNNKLLLLLGVTLILGCETLKHVGEEVEGAFDQAGISYKDVSDDLGLPVQFVKYPTLLVGTNYFFLKPVSRCLKLEIAGDSIDDFLVSVKNYHSSTPEFKECLSPKAWIVDPDKSKNRTKAEWLSRVKGLFAKLLVGYIENKAF